ncbi:unnamed protein product, partial [Amoebophrya sp. A120]
RESLPPLLAAPEKNARPAQPVVGGEGDDHDDQATVLMNAEEEQDDLHDRAEAGSPTTLVHNVEGARVPAEVD